MSTKPEFTDDGGCWVEIRPGRKKLFGKNHPVTQMARSNLTLDFIKEAKKEGSRGGKGVTVYYRDETGKVCLPPSPDMVPKGYDRLEAHGTRGQDLLAKELERDAKAQFGEDHFTAFMDERQDNPRDFLARTHCMSSYEREFIGAALKAMDEAEADRRRIGVTAHFPVREQM